MHSLTGNDIITTRQQCQYLRVLHTISINQANVTVSRESAPPPPIHTHTHTQTGGTISWFLGYSLESCWFRVTFRASLRTEHPRLFIDCRQSCVCVCLRVCVGECTVGWRRHVFWLGGGCFSAAHVPLSHKTGAEGHLKVSPSKKLSPLAVANSKRE